MTKARREKSCDSRCMACSGSSSPGPACNDPTALIAHPPASGSSRLPSWGQPPHSARRLVHVVGANDACTTRGPGPGVPRIAHRTQTGPTCLSFFSPLPRIPTSPHKPSRTIWPGFRPKEKEECVLESVGSGETAEREGVVCSGFHKPDRLGRPAGVRERVSRGLTCRGAGALLMGKTLVSRRLHSVWWGSRDTHHHFSNGYCEVK
ncbi:hypothetical protein B0J18DRAFT_49606 [Chaetomium sp. MPI-SDFR-AT-0129]|nr:hypothetical protein B0J18DRAFT_49606 [Chaetomium sp. MPI-SDFR-AT-0129]